MEIDYSNLKDTISREQGHDRANIYGKVWDVLYPLGKIEKPTKADLWIH
jgi:hypothetical protein